MSASEGAIVVNRIPQFAQSEVIASRSTATTPLPVAKLDELLNEDWFVISATGDGAFASLVPQSQLHQQLHDSLCCCAKPWESCGTEDIVATVKSLDVEESWSRDYPDYRPRNFTLHGEDGSIEVIRLDAAPQLAAQNRTLEAERDKAQDESWENWQSVKKWKVRSEMLAAKLDKIASWLERNAERARTNAKNAERFPSLAEACAADAKNYEATAKDIRAALAEAEGAQ